MNLHITIKKRHAYLFSLIIVLIGGILFVRGYGTSSPSIFGHSSGEVDVVINGATKTLQQAIDDGSIAPPPSQTLNCVNQTSAWNGPPPDINATCPSGTILVGGGCEWDDTDYKWSNALSFPNYKDRSWRCKSKDGTRKARANAFCCSLV